MQTSSFPLSLISVFQFFILIAEWTVHYQHVSDPLVSEGNAAVLQDTEMRGFSSKRINNEDDLEGGKNWLRVILY